MAAPSLVSTCWTWFSAVRSVIARRLRHLDVLGLLARAAGGGRPARGAPYRLAPAGEALVPTLTALYHWAARWVPEDPALAQRDLSLCTWWLAQRVDPAAVPEGPVVVAFAAGAVRLYGEPALVRALPGWFRPQEAGAPPAARPTAHRRGRITRL